MTVARRLTAVESSLSPTEIVCAWLDEAHAFDSLEAYVGSQLEQPDDQHVPDRLLFQARDAARKRVSGTKDADDQVRQALRETLFRFELVLRINVLVHETLERETLIRMVIGLRFAMLFQEQDDPAAGRSCAQLLLLADRRWRYLRNLSAARETVESAHLAGHAALFPAQERRLHEALQEMGQLVAMAARIGERDGWLPPGEPETPEQTEAIVAGLVDDIVEPAKVQALEKLDEGRRAFGIASRWLRPKLAQ